jgi:hypothetical protein
LRPPFPPLKSVKVLDQLRERIGYLHYSIRTKDVYVYWVRTLRVLLLLGVADARQAAFLSVRGGSPLRCPLHRGQVGRRLTWGR